MMRQLDAPSGAAASMNSFSFSDEHLAAHEAGHAHPRHEHQRG